MPTTISASDYLEAALLDHAFRNTTYTPPSAIYVALYTAATSDTGGGSEVTGGSYARQATSFAAAASGQAATDADVSYSDMPAATITHIGLLDADTGGNLLLWGELDSPVETTAGDPLTIAAGDLTVAIAQTGGAGFTEYLCDELLDHVLRSESYSPAATLELALYDETGTELTGGSYARQVITFGSPTAGEVANTGPGEFTNLPAAQVEEFRVHEDSASGGQAVAVGSLPSRDVAAGSGATWDAGDFTVAMD